MELEGTHYVFAAYAVTFLVLFVWMWMIGTKVRRLDEQSRAGEAADGGTTRNR